MRSDKGSHHLTTRTQQALRWIGEQYVSRFDHLQVLLGQNPQGTDKTPRILSEDATRKVIATWRAQNYVLYKKVYVDQPAYLWLSKAGIRMTGLPVRFSTPPEGALLHYHAINTVRLYLRFREPQGEWEGERLIKARLEAGRKGRRLPHTPDAWFTRADGQQIIGIETELHAKGKDVYYHIHGGFGGMLMQADEIWYFGTPAARTALRHAVEETGMRQARKRFRFQLFPLNWEEEQVYPPPLL